MGLYRVCYGDRHRNALRSKRVASNNKLKQTKMHRLY